MGLRVRVEKSVSRSGLHMRIATYFVVKSDCSRATPQIIERILIKPTYVKGEAYELLIEVPQESYVVQVDMTRNPRKRVRGNIIIYDTRGNIIARAVYRKLKIRIVEYYVDQRLAYGVVRCVANTLKLPVKKYGVPRRKGGGS